MTRHRDRLLVANEVALAGVTLAAAAGMHRLFVDGSFLGPLVLQVVVAHLVVAALRRAGVRLVPALALTVLAAVLFITWTRFPESTRWLLPTGETLSQVADDISASWRLFGDVSAPAPVTNGFIVTAAGAIWVLAFVADWAAFRSSATFEALLPATTLVLVSAALGGTGSPVSSAALFAAAALVHLLLHRTATQERSSRWAGGRRTHGRSSLVSTGTALLGAAVVAGAIAGPRLPGADADAIVDWRNLNKDEPTRVVLSPIVQLQTQLVDQPDVEVFTVRSSQPSYWRLTSLGSFDGDIWRSSYSTDDASGDLPRAFDTSAESRTVTQTFTIEALSSVWLPAAYEPVAIDTGDQPTDYDARSSTLMVDREVPTSDGYSYEVTSQVPNWSEQELRTASDDVPGDIADVYLDLPGDFPDQAADEAARLTAGAATGYDKARAIQAHLRTFTYDDTVGPGHSDDALLTFLFDTRRGYCEQFSAAFAALARSAGLPSRVAIGFTSGIRDPNDPDLYRVRGMHAHAWPEVYLGEYGWVPFEPTPDRGPQGAEQWLGIPAGQDTSAGGVGDAAGGADLGFDPGGDTGTAGGVGDDQRSPAGGVEDGAPAEAAPAEDDTPLVPEPVRDAALPVGLAALAYSLLVPSALVTLEVTRRRRARAPAARARYLWRTMVDQASSDDLPLPSHLTIAEMADRLSEAMPAAAADVQALARTMEAIAYAGTPPSEDDIDRAQRAWAAVVAESQRRIGWPRRVGRLLDVRRLFGTRRDRQIAHRGPALIPPA